MKILSLILCLSGVAANVLLPWLLTRDDGEVRICYFIIVL